MQLLTPGQADWIWAILELGATAFMIAQIIEIRRVKELRGAQWYMTAFYILWGIINVPAYHAVGQHKAMVAGMVMTAANLVWLRYAIPYSRRPISKAIDVAQLKAARLLRAAAEDGLLALKALQGGASMGSLMVASQAVCNLENAIGTAQIRGIERAANMDGDAPWSPQRRDTTLKARG